jgi:hypothetical protein
VKGRVEPDGVVRHYRADCGRCERTLRVQVDVGGRTLAEHRLRLWHGWSLTVARGWVCEACAARRHKQLDGTVVET